MRTLDINSPSFKGSSKSVLFGEAYGIGGDAGMALGLAIGRVNPCSVGGMAGVGIRGINALQASGSALDGYRAYQNGDYLGAAIGFAGAGASVGGIWGACFAAGTPILTPNGPKLVEDVCTGDHVLSRDEFDPSGPVEPREVLVTVTNYTTIWHVHIGNRIIRTTAEHPLFSRTRGWIGVSGLEEGEEVRTYLGWTNIGKVINTGEWETVYNFAVEGWHTYFVGTNEVEAIWAHNRCGPLQQLEQSKNSARSSLRRSMGLKPGDPNKAHHAIPWEHRNHPVVKDAARRGWEINRPGNGVSLSPGQHPGNHPRYNNGVRDDLDDIFTRNGGATDSAYQEFLDYVSSLTNELPKIPSPLR